MSSIFSAGPLEPLAGGLLSVASVTYHSDDSRLVHGVAGWDTNAFPAELILTDECTGTGSGAISKDDGARTQDVRPVGIVSRHECILPGRTPAERQTIAKAQAEAGTQKALESELWSGHLSRSTNQLASRYLLDNRAVDVTPSGSMNIVNGVAVLEDGLGQMGLGLQGVIHMPRLVAQVCATEGAIRMDKDGVLRTRLGTPVVAGGGYNITEEPLVPVQTAFPVLSPAPVARDLTGAAYMFATGPVYVHLGGVEVLVEVFDPFTNVYTAQASRPSIVYWDSQFSLQVTGRYNLA